MKLTRKELDLMKIYFIFLSQTQPREVASWSKHSYDLQFSVASKKILSSFSPLSYPWLTLWKIIMGNLIDMASEAPMSNTPHKSQIPLEEMDAIVFLFYHLAGRGRPPSISPLQPRQWKTATLMQREATICETSSLCQWTFCLKTTLLT